jgi:predicted porin
MHTRVCEEETCDVTGYRRWHFRKVGAIATLLIVLWPYAVSFSDQGVAFTLSNRTTYYLHATVNNTSYVYIAPGGVVTYQSDTFSNVVVEVTYSPGQSVTGRASKTFEAVRQDTATRSNTCTDNNSDCHSTTSYSSSVSPLSWDVTASDLTSN